MTSPLPSLRVLSDQMGREPPVLGPCEEEVRKGTSNANTGTGTEVPPPTDARSSFWLWEPFAL